jgi:hypothetical protein
MQQALASREQALEAIAAAFMNDPANAEAIADEKLWDATDVPPVSVALGFGVRGLI